MIVATTRWDVHAAASGSAAADLTANTPAMDRA
jgi:hypothetical protein